MDTNKKKEGISKRQKCVIVIGIYEDDEKGILITRRDDGDFQLPGGNVWYTADSSPEEIDSKLKEEISRIIFEKSGLSLDPIYPEESFQVRITKARKTHTCNVFIMAQNSTPGKSEWKRDKRFEGDYIHADLQTIIKYYPSLSKSDLLIIAKYLDVDKDEVFKIQMRQKLKVV